MYTNFLDYDIKELRCYVRISYYRNKIVTDTAPANGSSSGVVGEEPAVHAKVADQEVYIGGTMDYESECFS